MAWPTVTTVSGRVWCGQFRWCYTTPIQIFRYCYLLAPWWPPGTVPSSAMVAARYFLALWWPPAVLRSRSWSEPVLFGRSRSRCEDVKAKTCFLLLFSLFLYEEEPEPEPVKKKYLEPEPVKSGPAPQHWPPGTVPSSARGGRATRLFLAIWYGGRQLLSIAIMAARYRYFLSLWWLPGIF